MIYYIVILAVLVVLLVVLFIIKKTNKNKSTASVNSSSADQFDPATVIGASPNNSQPTEPSSNNFATAEPLTKPAEPQIQVDTASTPDLSMPAEPADTAINSEPLTPPVASSTSLDNSGAVDQTPIDDN